MINLLIIITLLALFITLYRFLKGPTLSDRIVSFDVLSIISISLFIILALYFQRAIYIDIALVIGLIGFIGSTIFGRYIEKGI